MIKNFENFLNESNIRVYDILDKDGEKIISDEFDEEAISLNNWKENRKKKYGNDISFKFKYVYSC